MTIEMLDATGLRRPQPRLRLTAKAIAMRPGDIIEVVADCPDFESDVRSWCSRFNKALLWLRDEGNGVKRCQITTVEGDNGEY